MNDSQEQVSIRVLFFGAARDAVPSNPLEMSLAAPATVRNAFRALVERFGDLGRFGNSLLFAVNQEYATPETLLKENDELAVFPPVSGGAQDFFELTTEPIDVGQVARRVVLPECDRHSTLGQHNAPRDLTHIDRRVVLPESGATVTLD